MTEYMMADDGEHLVGKRAEIKNPCEGYSYNLHGAKGIIEYAFGMLFLKFYSPVQLGSKAWTMKGVYLTHGSFNLI